MDTEGIPARAIAMVIVAFLFLAGVHLWWQTRDKKDRAESGEMVMDDAQVHSEDREIDLGGQSGGSDRENARKREMQRLLKVLATGSDAGKRRSAALRLQYLADRSAEPELIELLRSDDQIVARRCAETLLGLWQESDSHSVNRLMKRGLSAYEDGEYEEAMARFEMCAELDPEIPDLHRLMAGIMLRQGRLDAAIRTCEKAISLEPHNFMAHYVLARCYRRTSRGDAALQQVDQALDIYPGYQPAGQLRVEILSLQKAGEL
jgi:tetratricopeptide (TPR) repeat protein